MIVVRKFFILIIAFFIQTTCTAAPLEISLSKGVTFGYNMGADDPEDPFFLGPPVFLSVSNPAIIQSATFWIDMGPIRVESVESVQSEEFDIEFVQEETILKMSINRAEPRTIEGNQLIQIKQDRFSHGDLGIGIGEFAFRLTEINSINGVEKQLETVYGSWSFISDVSVGLNLRLISTIDQKPLEGFKVKQMGFMQSPNFFGIEGYQLQDTDENGMINAGYPADPHLLYNEINGCLVPKEGLEITFIFLVEPPENSTFDPQTFQVTVSPLEQCNELEGSSTFPVPEVALFPKSRVSYWSLYSQ